MCLLYSTLKFGNTEYWILCMLEKYIVWIQPKSTLRSYNFHRKNYKLSHNQYNAYSCVYYSEYYVLDPNAIH